MEICNNDVLYIILREVMYDKFCYNTKKNLKTVCRQFNDVIEHIPGCHILTKKYNKINNIVKYLSAFLHKLSERIRKDLYVIFNITTDNVYKSKIALILGDLNLIKSLKSYCIRYPWIAIGYSNIDVLVSLVHMGCNISSTSHKCIFWACVSNNIEALRYMKLKLCVYNSQVISLCIRKRQFDIVHILAHMDKKYIQDVSSYIYEEMYISRCLCGMLDDLHPYITDNNIQELKCEKCVDRMIYYMCNQTRWLHVMDALSKFNTIDYINKVKQNIDLYINQYGYVWIHQIHDYPNLCMFVLVHKFKNYDTYKDDIICNIIRNYEWKYGVYNTEYFFKYEPYGYEFIERYRLNVHK